MERSLKRIIKNKKGLSYFELIAGMSIFLIAITAFVSIYRFSSINKNISREWSAMATVAQNMAEVYEATPGTTDDAIDAAIREAVQNEGFTEDKLVFIPPKGQPSTRLSSNPSDYRYNICKVTIKVSPRISTKGIDPYVLVFYSLDKSNVN